MRVIIAGSRRFVTYRDVEDAVKASGFDVTTVLSGTAKGADRLGEGWANNHYVPLERFPADWEAHGKSAGYKRNVTMAESADALVALWDGKSRGTGHMIDIARHKGLAVFVHIVTP